jgi:hypothetical protein
MGKIIVEIGRTLAKAVLAGVGVELARLVSVHMRKRLDPTDVEAPAEEPEGSEELKAENAKLKAEVDKLKTELGKED